MALEEARVEKSMPFLNVEITECNPLTAQT